MIHELKVWPVFFDAILTGRKTFEVRRNDRGFQTLDLLLLREYNPDVMRYLSGEVPQRYTGRVIHARIGYLLAGYGISDGYVVMALADLKEGWQS